MALASATKLTRKSQWKHFYEFCARYNLSPIPCDSRTLCLYIAHMCRKFKYSSITQYISAVVYLQKLQGLVPMSTKDFSVSRTMAGARRLLGDKVKQAVPLSPRDLARIYEFLDMSSSRDLCWWTAAIMAFRGLLRKAHVTVSDQAIRVSDVTFMPWGVLLRLNKTKTIQYGERSLEIPFSYAHDSIFCVATYVKRLIVSLRLHSTDYLFQYKTGSRRVPQTYGVFSAQLKALSSRVGLKDISSHSLRRRGGPLSCSPLVSPWWRSNPGEIGGPSQYCCI